MSTETLSYCVTQAGSQAGLTVTEESRSSTAAVAVQDDRDGGKAAWPRPSSGGGNVSRPLRVAVGQRKGNFKRAICCWAHGGSQMPIAETSKVFFFCVIDSYVYIHTYIGWAPRIGGPRAGAACGPSWMLILPVMLHLVSLVQEAQLVKMQYY